MGEEACSWDLKDNIRSVILDWRQRPTGHSSRPASSPMSVLQPSFLYTQKGPRHRRNICADSLWLYSYFTQTSPSKNKNINDIFIYLCVLRCLSSSTMSNIPKRFTTSINTIYIYIYIYKQKKIKSYLLKFIP